MEWTLDELVARVSVALGAADYPGAPNGRVREVPDRRAIRWYTTIGLLDRPGGMRGRSALYGPRHLAQLVAIKRRQAQGRSLAEIQAELVGVTDAALREIAGVEVERAAPERKRGAFWAQAVTAEAPEAVHAAPETGAARVAPEAEAARLAPAPGAVRAAPVPGAAAGRAALAPERSDYPGVLTGVTLEGGAVLLLPTRPGPDDIAALRAAAAPLIDLLAARGLLHGDARSST